MRITTFALLNLFFYCSPISGQTIAPSIKKGQKRLTENSLGLIWLKRKTIGSEFYYSSSETTSGQTTSETKVLLARPFVFYHKDMFSLEASFAYGENKTEDNVSSNNDTDSNFTLPTMNTAIRINQDWGIGAGLKKLSYDYNALGADYRSETQMIDFAISYRFNEWVLIGINYQKTTDNTEISGAADQPELQYDTVTFGVSLLNISIPWQYGYTLEIYYQEKDGASDTSNSTLFSSPETTTFGIGFIYQKDFYELETKVEFTKSSYPDLSKKSDGNVLFAEIELLLNEHLYLSPSIGYTLNEESGTTSNTDEKINLYGLKFGYRAKGYDIDLNYIIENKDEEVQNSSTSFETKTSTIQLTYAQYF
jgi:hypothetical protein